MHAFPDSPFNPEPRDNHNLPQIQTTFWDPDMIATHCTAIIWARVWEPPLVILHLLSRLWSANRLQHTTVASIAQGSSWWSDVEWITHF